ncbi:MAG TPA: epoxide hydrolase [Candidatus Dormibacteraeota bacterium]|nr:epoxide hydrolase [Candidatus Dormibacteraeota bacterium]
MAQQAATRGEVKPFRIDVPQADLDDLQRRIATTRWPDELPGTGWSYGVPVGYVKALAEHWAQRYDWRKWEADLNALPQFMTSIDGQDIHFVHLRSKEPNALPLLVTHGWPGSVVELMKVIRPLADPQRFGGDAAEAFHVVAPSIPGYGFSGPTHETGWDVKRIAGAFDELMGRLGYDRYGTQGGDWGSVISRQLGLMHPDHVIGSHYNTLAATPSGDPEEMKLLSDKERSFLERGQRFQQQGSGYYMIQGSRPQTLAYGLTDSPVGLLAWISEKFTEWADPASVIDREQILTNVSVYWFTGTVNSASRLYAEFGRSGSAWGKVEPSTVPSGVAQFPYEIFPPIRRFAERSNRIVHWTEFEHGGHFAAMEQPDLLVGDVRAFFRNLRLNR